MAGEPTEGPLTQEELQLATRNRGMPLEALRYDLTPTGIHYLLTHFDIPDIEMSSWRLEVTGNVERQLSLSLDDIRSRTPRTIPVTMECAGNGRARLSPRPISNPWLNEAIGTAEWTGTPLRDVIADAGFDPAPRSLSSPARTTAPRATSSTTTNGASPSARRPARRCCSPTR
jgi:sulfane dehydrogenase subunit SoxC